MNEGIKRLQDVQTRWLDKMNEREIVWGLWGMSFDVSCKDCNERKHFGCAESARRYIESHAGHRTWVEKR